jgi:hypothetical protein
MVTIEADIFSCNHEFEGDDADEYRSGYAAGVLD